MSGVTNTILSADNSAAAGTSNNLEVTNSGNGGVLNRKRTRSHADLEEENIEVEYNSSNRHIQKPVSIHDANISHNNPRMASSHAGGNGADESGLVCV